MDDRAVAKKKKLGAVDSCNSFLKNKYVIIISTFCLYFIFIFFLGHIFHLFCVL